MTRTGTAWLVWLLATLAGAGVLASGMLLGGPMRANLLIGTTTSGHHQIELACEACHTTPFAGREAIQKACVGCHGEDLKLAKDSHPAKKFTDPRNADRLLKLEATQCVTCHTEHRAEITRAMGVTLPGDFCALCHQSIGNDRPSHRGLSFSTCADAGCHNYHDNRALYEDFLEKHAAAPPVHPEAVVKLRADPPPRTPARESIRDAGMADAPLARTGGPEIARDWLATAHAAAGVNCSGCHAPQAKSPERIAEDWVERPDHTVCGKCHASQARTFTEGRHGMRLAAGLKARQAGLFGLFRDEPLSPMRPELARASMSQNAGGIELGCTTCHAAHAFDTSKAEVELCLGCHSDEHSRAYVGSPHHRLWKAELSGTAPAGSGVSCATCHLPRQSHEDPDSGEERLVVDHNQNSTLRPNEKMIRAVCMDCHGLGFALDALADPKSISSNFAGPPSARVESIQWVEKRRKAREGQGAGEGGTN